ncbi:MAG: hypothetical protein FJ029_14905, partial [Actinobacteria bacterium]|nr:hypothetical protein [Actinomycetota bacterium]
DPPDSRRPLDPPGRGWFGFGAHGLGFATYDGGPAHAYEVLGDRGRLLILNDFEDALLFEPAEGAAPGERPGLKARPLAFAPNPPGWEAGPTMMRELVRAIETGEPTACDMARARITTELGFAFHASHALGGARVTFPITNRNLRVISYVWGNE